MTSPLGKGQGMGAQIATVFRDRALGSIGLALFTHGCGQGMYIPFVALWIVGSYHLGAAAVAAYFACSAAGGLVLNPLLGRMSDTLGRRRPTATLAALMQAAGLGLLALHPAFPLVLAAATALMSAQVQPHLFAMVNDYVGDGRSGLPRGATVAIERSTISAAWAVGAPLGGLLLGHYALLFAAAGIANAVSAVAIVALCREDGGLRPARRRPADGRAGAEPSGGAVPVRWGEMLLFGLGIALIGAGNASKMQAVPLYLSRLGVHGVLVGAVYSWMALGEMVFMPPAGRLADRFSRKWVIALGTAGGVLFFAAVALVRGALTVVVAFPAVSYMIAAVFGVGIGYAQDLDPAHPGLAGGIYFAAQGVGITAGGALIAASEARFGLPHAFLGPALAILCGGVGILFTRPQRGVAARAARTAAVLTGE